MPFFTLEPTHPPTFRPKDLLCFLLAIVVTNNNCKKFYINDDILILILMRKQQTCIQLPTPLKKQVDMVMQETGWTQNFIVEEALKIFFSPEVQIKFRKKSMSFPVYSKSKT